MKLPDVRGIYKKDYSLSRLTWFKVGGNADILFKPEDEDDLANFLKANNGTLPVTTIGAGSNIIIRDGGITGVVVKLGRKFTEIDILPNNCILAGAGCLNFNLAKFACAHAIKRLEFLVGIPGTVGGGIAMNAGSYGYEFKDIVKTVHALDSLGNRHQIPFSDIGFGYRKNSLPADMIFTKVELKAEPGNIDEINSIMQKISKQRAQTQPITEKTGGSTFANPEGAKAWQLIDNAGLRGKMIGGAIMSSKHCNFMVNYNNAKAYDMEQLGEFVRREVEKKSGINLKWEIKIIGRYE
jgi:UDP-N-acetylmuramate dehydrogenase